jgi:hypothetical protein
MKVPPPSSNEMSITTKHIFAEADKCALLCR